MRSFVSKNAQFVKNGGLVWCQKTLSNKVVYLQF